MNYKEFRCHITQRYVRDVWLEYCVSDRSCIVKIELQSGDVKMLMLSNSHDVEHRYRMCDTAIRAVINTGWILPIRVVPLID